MKGLLYSVAGVLLLVLFYFIITRKAQRAAQDALRSELMVVHDAVMPKMGELTRLAGQLKQVLERDSTLSAESRATLEGAVAQMVVAEEGMMDWMAAFKQPESLRAAHEDHAAILKYLEGEKKTIRQVADQINTGIETGKALLAAPNSATPQ